MGDYNAVEATDSETVSWVEDQLVHVGANLMAFSDPYLNGLSGVLISNETFDFLLSRIPGAFRADRGTP